VGGRIELERRVHGIAQRRVSGLHAPESAAQSTDRRRLHHLEGETVFQILGGSGSALDVPDPTTVLDLVGYPDLPEDDLEAFLKPDTVHNSFAQDLPEADRWLIVSSQRPITLSANTTPSGAPAWKTLPSWTVVGTADLVIPPGTQHSMAERAGATIREVAGSHVSMVSQPQAAIDAIMAAAPTV
jgi:pimeloyl-ACP methyl ester carboxylesterase